MTKRGALAMGLLAVVGYVTAGWITGLWADRPVPLLDGLAPPPTYRYVQTPAGRAPGKQPYSGRFTVRLSAGGSSVYAFTTRDQQVSITLVPRALPVMAGQKRVIFTITPLAPDGFPPPPQGKGIDGNVYRILARYEPGGKLLAKLARPAHLGLAYPAQATTRTPQHFLVFSRDGKRWADIGGDDALVFQGVRKHVERLGYFAVAGPPVSSGTRSPWQTWAGIGVVIIVAGLVIAIFRVGRRSS